jgi:hypothetical protein
MEAKVIQIGTSKGIRIPASMLKHFDNPTSFDRRYPRLGYARCMGSTK